jgi:hypothetical protein
VRHLGLASLALIAACGDDGAAPADAPIDEAVQTCACAYGASALSGTIGENSVKELSGVAASIAVPNIVWSHEDGDRTAIYAFSTTGATKGEVELTGVTTTDLEDIAVAPCSGGSCVYRADIGDNGLSRATVQIHEFPEPATIDGTMSLTPRTFDIAYPTSPHNSEALFIDPRDGASYVITKQTSNPSAVFEMPRTLGATATATQAGKISIPNGDKQVTAADLHTDSCGTKLLVRTYDALYELTGAPDATVAQLLAAPLVKVPVSLETQGEAVTYARDGRGYFTLSEEPSGVAPKLMRVACQ